MSRPDRPIALIDLDHAPADQHRTLIRVLARIAAELGPPAEAELLVSRSEAAWRSFPARHWTQDPAGFWRGVFAVPSAIVERAEFGFALHTAGHTLSLPHPRFAGVAGATAPGMIAVPIFTEPSTPTVQEFTRLTSGRLRTRSVAVATMLAVTTASSPALAVAGQVISTVPTGHAQATRERIEQLAVLAIARARAQAARTRARERTPSQGSGTSTATKRPAAPDAASRGRAGAADCLHPVAIVAGTSRAAHAVAPPIHCGALIGTVTSTPAAPPTSANPRPATRVPPETPPAPASATVTPASPAAQVPTATATATPSPTPTAAPAPTTTAAPTAPAVPTPTTTTTASTAPATTPAPTPPTPSGGGALSTGTAPAPVTTPPVQRAAPTAPARLSPVAPPTLASSGREHPSRPQLPVTFPSAKGNGAGSLHPHGDRARPHPQAVRSTGGTALTMTPSPPGFLGPKSWTGTVVNDPSLQSLLGNLSAVLHDINRPPRFLIPIYMEAGRRYHVPWPVLAAINSVETDYGRNLNTSSAGAIGWMQFEPSTWKEWGVAVDGHSVANPYDPRDAIFSAARYLAAAGASADISRAIYAYNHAGWYVDMVLARARAISAGDTPHTQTNGRGIITTFFDQWRGRWRAPYRGGYLTHFTRLVASANMVSAADFPYLWGGGHEQPARFGPFDCSGSVSYVLQQAGYNVPTSTSGNVARWHFPAGPGRVTIFYNATHTFMRIGNRYFGTSTSRPGGGAGWIGTDRLPESYLANFNEVHVPWLHGDAFLAGRRHRLAAERRAAHATNPAPLRLTPLSAQTNPKLQRTFPSAQTSSRLQPTFP